MRVLGHKPRLHCLLSVIECLYLSLSMVAMPNTRVKRDARTAGFTSWLRPRAGAPYPKRYAPPVGVGSCCQIT